MIKIDKLRKRYGKMEALKGLSLEIDKGTVFGFVGPNGAGKSTSMSILATLLEPTSGKAYVGGYEVTSHPRQVRKLIGYMPDFFGVYDNLTAEEYLDFYGANYDIPVQERRQIIPQLLELVNLSHKRDAYVDSLSRGMKQRLGLARCLVHNPEVLILDEPASGLDPRARIELREILKELRDMGKTIIISSHILPELAEMCDVIGVIEEGNLIAFGKVEEIYARMQEKRVLRIRLVDRMEDALTHLKQQPLVSNVTREGNWAVVGFSGDDQQQVELLRSLALAGLPVAAFNEAEGNLEEIFLEITKGVGS
ncbi:MULTISPECIES: ABC transporter ATP-binding protein [Brevibacillus]|uniref:ABC transporter ATP-binding protein n=1 Tax=Brevibacillus borstelensis AK1 TaxID=1300222 RepID=M8D2G4_9BACL|nr:ABC transporter ATP-binding protein [Brevibacillus borstelensis]EMT50424.1 ABC transporter ATP-binding protein [Brevibacillus borstelensis AK1]KKX57087.1 ABC transporter [Brevibacillus borstelensis cifa_chp40]MBE5395755.1 ABC transporter ATP-binding protein [Brevibacillus borstelensis]MCC0563965.1 ABC transporter ATP-binding protein [Brevibacillus borstelensis]MCM3558429.1 ABC transporter ATP-binding protein [Brevibacillus borstelensis]